MRSHEEEGDGGLQEVLALASLHEGAKPLVRFVGSPAHHYGFALPESEAGLLPYVPILAPQHHGGARAVHDSRSHISTATTTTYCRQAIQASPNPASDAATREGRHILQL